MRRAPVPGLRDAHCGPERRLPKPASGQVPAHTREFAAAQETSVCRDWVVVQVVACEPVSAYISLFRPGKQGFLHTLASRLPLQARLAQRSQRLASGFPAVESREILGLEQG